LKIYANGVEVLGDAEIHVPLGTTSLEIVTIPEQDIQRLKIRGNQGFRPGDNEVVILDESQPDSRTLVLTVIAEDKPTNLDEGTISIRPGVGMLAVFRAMDYTLWGAFGELVDNSYQSFEQHKHALRQLHGPNYKLKIEIEFGTYPSDFAIVRDNAAGISEQNMQSAFTPALRRLDQSGLGRFGVGMKSATVWYANLITVTSKALGEGVSRTVTLDVPKIISENTEMLTPEVSPKDPEEHGTVIHLRSLLQGTPRGRTLGRLRTYLASIYRELLRNNEAIIVVDGEPLAFVDRAILSEPFWPTSDGPLTQIENGVRTASEKILWKFPIEFELSESWANDMSSPKPERPAKIRGWAGILAEGSSSYSGFALKWRGKVVNGASDQDIHRPREVVGAPNTFAFQRILGELDVSELEPTFDKTGISWAPYQLDDFNQQLRRAISETLPHSLLRQANNYRSTHSGAEISDEVQRVLENTRSEVTQALLDALAAQADLMPSDPGRVLFELDEVPAESEGEILIYRDDASNYNYKLEIISNPLEPRLLSTIQSNSDLVIRINRHHPFMQNYANLPGAQLDPVIRILVAVALTKIKLERESVPGWHLSMDYVNAFLRTWFGNNGADA